MLLRRPNLRIQEYTVQKQDAESDAAPGPIPNLSLMQSPSTGTGTMPPSPIIIMILLFYAATSHFAGRDALQYTITGMPVI